MQAHTEQRMASNKGSIRKKTNVLQLIYKHRHQCLKQLLPQLKELNWNDAKDSQDSYGSYPLHYVLFYCTGSGVLEVVQYILQQDSDALYKENRHQMTPIHVMPGVTFSGDAHKYSLESIQRDQLKARSYMMKKDPSILKHVNNFGRLPISEAVSKGCIRIVKQMLKEYPLLASEKEADGRLALYHAIQKQNPIATTLLISYYPKGLMQCARAEHSQTLLQAALASPTLAMPVCKQLGKILEDVSTLQDQLATAQDKLKANTSTLRNKKSPTRQTKELQGDLTLGGSSSTSFTRSSTSASRLDTAYGNVAFDSRQEYYWKQVRKSEIICLKNITQESDGGDPEPSVEDLKAIANSLARRLDCYTNNPSTAKSFCRFAAVSSMESSDSSIRRNEPKTMAQIAAEYCLKHPDPDRNDLYQTIDALNQELIKLEGKDTTGNDDTDEQADAISPPSKRLKRSSSTKQAAVAIMGSANDEVGSDDLWL